MAEQITFLFGYALTQLKNAKGETIRVKDQEYRKKAFEEILVTWPDVCDVRFWYDSHSSQVHMRRLVLFLSPLWLEKVDILYGWIKRSCDFWRDKAQGMFFFFFLFHLEERRPFRAEWKCRDWWLLYFRVSESSWHCCGFVCRLVCMELLWLLDNTNMFFSNWPGNVWMG